MDTYLVGGAVRDKLLGYPFTEKDWVVVGASPEMLTTQGFIPVGRDFPVFLHPDTREEYALARTERKTGPGYAGFTFHTATDVTLEQDLERRDLTINAMAEDQNGQLIDPYGGAQDLADKQLRHVSPAFAEDPVRVLRVARFAARYHHLGFTIAPETLTLMRTMVDNGEVDHLVPERVWKELERALGERSPRVFIESLRACGTLARLLPEVDTLFGVPQRAEHHPEVDTGLHTLLSLEQAARLTPSTEARFAVLLHDLGKGATPEAEWPRHIGHEQRGLALVDTVCRRLAVPKDYARLARHVAEYHTHCHRARELKPSTLLRLFKALDAFRKPDAFEAFLLSCEADARGRTGFEERDYPQADYLRGALRCCQAVDNRDIAAQGFTGKAFGEALDRERQHRLHQYRASHSLGEPQ